MAAPVAPASAGQHGAAVPAPGAAVCVTGATGYLAGAQPGLMCTGRCVPRVRITAAACRARRRPRRAHLVQGFPCRGCLAPSAQAAARAPRLRQHPHMHTPRAQATSCSSCSPRATRCTRPAATRATARRSRTCARCRTRASGCAWWPPTCWRRAASTRLSQAAAPSSTPRRPTCWSARAARCVARACVWAGRCVCVWGGGGGEATAGVGVGASVGARQAQSMAARRTCSLHTRHVHTTRRRSACSSGPQSPARKTCWPPLARRPACAASCSRRPRRPCSQTRASAVPGTSSARQTGTAALR
jgi:hypothetical protein